MTHFALLVLCVMRAMSTCHAQVSCDSLYAIEDKFREGKIGLILFDVPPRVISGMEKLNNYTGSKDKTGTVMYGVVIDEVGRASCLKFASTTNKLLIEEANSIVQSLRFAPALLRGKGIKSTMYVAVRFYEIKPKRHWR